MLPEHLSVAAMVGCVAGLFASRVAGGHGYGVVGDIAVGVVGALLGAFVLGLYITGHMLAPLGIGTRSLVVQSIVAFIAAGIPLAAIRVFAGSGLGGRRREGRRLYERRVYERRFRTAASWSMKVTGGRRLLRPWLFTPLPSERMPLNGAATPAPMPGQLTVYDGGEFLVQTNRASRRSP
jgi:uncharacterized membrane protein YeaQ/YmgE (transglycosylase-associated protein family)